MIKNLVKEVGIGLPAGFIIFVFSLGILTGVAVNTKQIHTEKQGCEYVEGERCKAVYVKESMRFLD